MKMKKRCPLQISKWLRLKIIQIIRNHYTLNLVYSTKIKNSMHPNVQYVPRPEPETLLIA